MRKQIKIIHEVLIPVTYSQIMPEVHFEWGDRIAGYLPSGDNFIPADPVANYYWNNREKTGGNDWGTSGKTKLIYFILDEHTNMVKVGNSIDPVERLRTLSRDMDSNLKLLFILPGVQKDKRELHDKLSKWRVEGEWFEYSMAVEKIIKSWNNE